MTDAPTILARIEERLGFVPVFFGPAVEHPEVLANLWHQTESAYLDNALPTLFKEKLATLLGRYCEVPYCLVCHACSLRPLGMSGSAVVALLTQTHPSDELVREVLERVGAAPRLVDFAGLGAADEQDLFALASTVYASGRWASAARARLRQRLAPADYRNLIVLTSYSKMCHEWMAAHPEVSYELDQRYRQNYAPLAAEAPSLVAVFAERGAVPSDEPGERLAVVASERAAEASSAVVISERQFGDVVATLQARVAAVTNSASEKDHLAQELRRTADFAQELIAIVSHDLRNPLSSVVMGARLVLQLEPGNGKIASPLRRVLSSAHRAERLIHDLLDFSQARAGGGIPMHPRPADLEGIARAAAEELEGAHPGRTIQIARAGDLSGEWDADRLAQLLSNLLANSISHGRADSPIELALRGADEAVSLAVRNANRAGPIPESLLPVLFDPFKRGIARAASPTRSVGLGLFIASEIVRGHRGRIDVSSTAEGTTFTVWLPRNGSSPGV